MSVVANESVALECRSQAVPPPVLTWKKDGRPLEPRPGVHLSTDKALLEVCRAGPGGGRTRSVQLSVTQHPGHILLTWSEAAAGASLGPHKAEPLAFHLFFTPSSKASWPWGMGALRRASGPTRGGSMRAGDCGDRSLDVNLSSTSSWLGRLRQCLDHTGLRSVTCKHTGAALLGWLEFKASP